ncbi:uncharacterized protein TM35_000391370, partial [Trypanosoma theileri]
MRSFGTLLLFCCTYWVWTSQYTTVVADESRVASVGEELNHLLTSSSNGLITNSPSALSSTPNRAHQQQITKSHQTPYGTTPNYVQFRQTDALSSDQSTTMDKTLTETQIKFLTPTVSVTEVKEHSQTVTPTVSVTE